MATVYGVTKENLLQTKALIEKKKQGGDIVSTHYTLVNDLSE